MALGFKKTILLTSVLVAIAGAAFVWSFISIPGPKTPSVPLPNPNGYDDFVAAGKMLGEGFDYKQAGEEALRKRAGEDKEALMRLRIGLGRQSRVPPSGQDARLEELGFLKRSGLALIGEGRLAVFEQRYADASKSFIDVIRLGVESSRGGPIIADMVGVALVNLGLTELEQTVPRLDAESCANAISSLEAVEKTMSNATTVLENEKAWVRQVHGTRGVLIALITRRQLKPVEQKVVASHQQLESRLAVLKTRLKDRAADKSR